jgi:hypothetical protein
MVASGRIGLIHLTLWRNNDPKIALCVRIVS